jgi:hypothetical protein
MNKKKLGKTFFGGHAEMLKLKKSKIIYAS